MYTTVVCYFSSSGSSQHNVAKCAPGQACGPGLTLAQGLLLCKHVRQIGLAAVLSCMSDESPHGVSKRGASMEPKRQQQISNEKQR